jgi:peptide/nickel transport system substrate-binding protein
MQAALYEGRGWSLGQRRDAAVDGPAHGRLSAAIGPIIEEQLRDNGFNVAMKLFDPDASPFFDLARSGNASLWIIVQCGSSAEPWGTLQHFHSRFASPAQGQQNSYIWANSQYMNPEYDAIINQMDGMNPLANDPAYVALASQATDIFLHDVLEVTG